MTVSRQVSDRRGGPAPYWYVIALFLLLALGLYVYHTATGFTPSRVAISALDFNVYWYGILITFGIALGAYVVADLVRRRANELFHRSVPTAIRQRELEETTLPEELRRSLQANGFRELGDVLLRWPFGPANVGLSRDDHAKLRDELLAQPGVREEWLDDAPWRQWNPEHVWNGLLWCLILAIVGAQIVARRRQPLFSQHIDSVLRLC